MTTTRNTATIASPLRLAILIGGIVAIGFGIAILVWPAITAVAVTGVIAVYAIIAGIVYGAIGLLSKTHGTGSRVGHVLLGLLFIVAGVYAFSSLQESAVFLGIFVSVMVGVMWIIEGFTALFTLGEPGTNAVTILFAIISVLAGFALLSGPVWGAGLLWWLLGISLIILGALNVIRAMSGPKAWSLPSSRLRDPGSSALRDVGVKAPSTDDQLDHLIHPVVVERGVAAHQDAEDRGAGHHLCEQGQLVAAAGPTEAALEGGQVTGQPGDHLVVELRVGHGVGDQARQRHPHFGLVEHHADRLHQHPDVIAQVAGPVRHGHGLGLQHRLVHELRLA